MVKKSTLNSLYKLSKVSLKQTLNAGFFQNGETGTSIGSTVFFT
jgi:hypothetical protein